MLNRLIIRLLLPIVTVILVPSTTCAQTTNICTFSQPDFSELKPDGNNLPSKLVTDSSPTQISVICNQPAKLIVSAPIQTSGPKFNPVSAFVTVQAAGNTTNSNSSSSLSLPAGISNLLINLSVDKGNPLEPGNYKYGVKFTVVP
jgi:hypothetical protein